MFNKTVKDIISNYFSHETVAFDDGSLELQKSETVNSRKNEMCKRYVEGKKDSVNSSKE